MPRPPTPRPAGEHLSTLSRVLRQIETDKKMKPERSKKIRRALSVAIEELTREASK